MRLRIFMGMLNKWMEKEWPEQSKVCHFNDKIKYVLDATTLLVQLQYVGLGKKLKIILTFQKKLQAILGHYWDKDWSIIFNYAIFAANAPIVFILRWNVVCNEKKSFFLFFLLKY